MLVSVVTKEQALLPCKFGVSSMFESTHTKNRTDPPLLVRSSVCKVLVFM